MIKRRWVGNLQIERLTWSLINSKTSDVLQILSFFKFTFPFTSLLTWLYFCQVSRYRWYPITVRDKTHDREVIIYSVTKTGVSNVTSPLLSVVIFHHSQPLYIIFNISLYFVPFQYSYHLCTTLFSGDSFTGIRRHISYSVCFWICFL